MWFVIHALHILLLPMRVVKLPRREWPETFARFRDKHYYIARVFVEATEEHRAAVDEWGNVVGAVSYSIEPDAVQVYSLGSRQRGAGSRLMRHVERRAQQLGIPVKLAAERSAVGFYARRGFKKLPAQKSACRIFYMVLR